VLYLSPESNYVASNLEVSVALFALFASLKLQMTNIFAHFSLSLSLFMCTSSANMKYDILKWSEMKAKKKKEKIIIIKRNLKEILLCKY
jgi:hypothetical protein